ncbi:MAG: flagellar basal body P-ring protein FlgI [Spirochaetales bacterium]|nr:flagellar basal body P-ring protein FlgI [Spirochaetales bacterium]
MNFAKSICFLLFFIIILSFLTAVPEVRIKEIATIGGMRENQLLGVGLVTGLGGRGDSPNTAMLKDAISNLVSHFGFSISAQDIRSRNCAVVIVSADIPSFMRTGDRIDVDVASLGDARSLESGILLQTPLRAANGQIYAIAQGLVIVSSERSAVKTVGRVRSGGIAERQVSSTLVVGNIISLQLKQPDFVTAKAVEEAIAANMAGLAVTVRTPALIEITVPENQLNNIIGLIADIQSIKVTPDASTKVVIDSRTGMIVMGENVKIGKVAVSYKTATVQVQSYYSPSDSSKEHFVINETISVEDFVKTMKEIGISTDTVITMLESIEKAGALYGTLIIK